MAECYCSSSLGGGGHRGTEDEEEGEKTGWEGEGESCESDTSSMSLSSTKGKGRKGRLSNAERLLRESVKNRLEEKSLLWKMFDGRGGRREGEGSGETEKRKEKEKKGEEEEEKEERVGEGQMGAGGEKGFQSEENRRKELPMIVIEEAEKEAKRKRDEEREENSEEYTEKKSKKNTPPEMREGKRREKEVEEKMVAVMDAFRREMMGAIRDIGREGREGREDIRSIKGRLEEWDDNWRKEKERVWEKLEGIDQKMEASDKKGDKEREEIRKRLEKLEQRDVNVRQLEKRIEELGGKRRGEKAEEEGGKAGVPEENEVVKELRREISEMKWREEKKERERRRSNVVIKGLKLRTEKGEEEVRKLLNEGLGLEVTVREVKRVGTVDREGRGRLVVKLEDEDQKRRIMTGKRKLKRRKERIEEDRAWGERRVQWIIERIAGRGKEKGRVVAVGSGRISVDREMWTWDDRKEKLFNREGKEWGEGDEQMERERERGEEKGSGD